MAGNEYVELNMNDRLNKVVAKVAVSTTRSQFNRWLLRQHKRGVFNFLLTCDSDGVLYPRTREIRAMVMCFREGHRAGHVKGWDAGRRYLRKQIRGAKDGR